VKSLTGPAPVKNPLSGPARPSELPLLLVEPGTAGGPPPPVQRSSAKAAEPIDMPLWVWEHTCVDPMNHDLDGVDIGAIW